jgi:hypothetical protein
MAKQKFTTQAKQTKSQSHNPSNHMHQMGQMTSTALKSYTTLANNIPFILRHALTLCLIGASLFAYFFLNILINDTMYEPYFFKQLAEFSTQQTITLQTIIAVIMSTILLWSTYAILGICILIILVITSHIHNRANILSIKTIRSTIIFSTSLMIIQLLVPFFETIVSQMSQTLAIQLNTLFILSATIWFISNIFTPHIKHYPVLLGLFLLIIPVPTTQLLPPIVQTILMSIYTYCVCATVLYYFTNNTQNQRQNTLNQQKVN